MDMDIFQRFDGVLSSRVFMTHFLVILDCKALNLDPHPSIKQILITFSNKIFFFSFLTSETLIQSRYFDCDDDESDDTFSNLSALIDSDDFLTHVDNEGFYCNGNDENCNYGYTVEGGTCNSDHDDEDGGCVSVVVNE